MSHYNIGLKALRRLIEEQDALKYHQSKLSGALFKGDEVAAHAWVTSHLTKHQKLPQLETFLAQFPEAKEVVVSEPASYYLGLLSNRYEYDVINRLNLDSQALLKADQTKVDVAFDMVEKARNDIVSQRYRHRIVDFGADGEKLVIQNYFNQHTNLEQACSFGWEYLDDMCGGVVPGDFISYVGRPASGKTFFMLYTAMHNWRVRKKNVLFASMEMNALPIAQRAAAMYAGTNLKQLKTAGYSSKTLSKFMGALSGLPENDSKLYIVDGNLSAYPEDLYVLAHQLDCEAVCFDAAYLFRHKNKRLDRYTRVAENVEDMKRMTTDSGMGTFASWQFAKTAATKKKKEGEKVNLEDIGYSDAIAQISSVVLALLQEEGVETIQTRDIDVLKGRGGEVGKFSVHWDFDVMDFSQVKPAEQLPQQLEYI